MFEKVINAPIRWAGSKKKLLNEMLEKMFPRNKKVYVESFLGSGIVLLNVLKNKERLGYEKFYVNDINANIINFYKLLKDEPDYLIENLSLLETMYNAKDMREREVFYYEIRSAFNLLDQQDKMKAIYFYFLMKTGFNGVYRENKKGSFNVPFGRKENISIQQEYLRQLSLLIQPVKFYSLDYREFFKVVERECALEESFLYCDPPYIPDDLIISKNQVLYTMDMFHHEEFCACISKFDRAAVMISMTDSTLADQVYNNGHFCKKDVTDIVRIVNPKKRFPSKEIAYINFELDTNEE